MIELLWNDKVVRLKSPEFGDTLGWKGQTIIKRAMDKTAYSFVERNENRVRNFDFANLSRVQVRNFFDFMEASKGKDVTLLDHDGQRWFGIIDTQPISSSHNGINNSALSFVFEGIKVA